MSLHPTSLLTEQILRSSGALRGVAVLGFGALALTAAGAWARQSRIDVLCSEVDRLNGEIENALAVGADLSGLRGIQTAVNSLADLGSSHAAQITLEMQNDRQAASDEPRAVWNPSSQRIEMRVDGEAGARGITLWVASRDGVPALA